MKLRRKSSDVRRKGRGARGALRLEVMERRQLMTIFTVSNNGDAGTGSLRAAILSANTNPGNDTIQFALPSTQLVITPATPLPSVSDSGTVIDGTTQTNFNRTTAQPLVVINGSNLPTTQQQTGLNVTGGNCTIKGLVIQSFSAVQIELLSSPGDIVQDCYLGTDALGLSAAPVPPGAARPGSASSPTIARSAGPARRRGT